MTNQLELTQEKKELMYEMLKNLSTWGETGVEEAKKILSVNNQAIQRMQEIDQQLTKDELTAYNITHRENWMKIIEKHETLTQWIDLEKQKTSEQLAQTGNKEKVISSYIGLQKESGLIRKNY